MIKLRRPKLRRDPRLPNLRERAQLPARVLNAEVQITGDRAGPRGSAQEASRPWYGAGTVDIGSKALIRFRAHASERHRLSRFRSHSQNPSCSTSTPATGT